MPQYKYVHLPEHPLANGQSKLPLHRVLLYEKIGPGEHACHHCGGKVEWLPGSKTRKGALVVDHLNGDKHDNALENLAPSCHRCNSTHRAPRRIQKGEPFVVATDGRRMRAVERSCATCGKTFLHNAADKRANAGRYCSKPCQYARNGTYSQRLREVRTCETCGGQFEWISGRSSGRYCSRKCAGIGNRKPIEMRACRICGIEFVYRGHGTPGLYCSRSCAGKGARKTRTWRVENGELIISAD